MSLTKALGTKPKAIGSVDSHELAPVADCTLLQGRPLAGPSLGFMVVTSAKSIATVGRTTGASPCLAARQLTGRKKEGTGCEENCLREAEGARDLETISGCLLFCG